MWLGVAIGGALGTLTRYGLTLLAGRMLAAFPVGTLLINVSGSFLLGLLLALTARGVVPEPWRVWLGTGFLGGYTTFSTFSVDTVMMAQRGDWRALALYLLGNVGAGLAAALAGLVLGARSGL